MRLVPASRGSAIDQRSIASVSVISGPKAVDLLPSSTCRGLEPPLDVKRLGRDEPRIFDAMEREIVEVQHGIDPNSDLHHCLSGRCKINKQNLLKPRCIFGFWRRSCGQRGFVVLGRQRTQVVVSQSVKLSARSKYLIK